MQTKVFDVIIFGGGVIGCSIFNVLTKSGYSTLLLEKCEDLAVGTSKANSGLVHAGFDAKPNSKKAIFNVEGNKMYPEICARMGVPLKKCGAYVVGNDINVVKTLYARGEKNGVSGLYILNRKQLVEKIPNLQEGITCGLFAENAYIVSPYLYTICLAEEGVVNGGKVELGYTATSAKYNGEYWEISDGKTTYFAKQVVNSAGSGYNQVAQLLKSEKYNIQFKRGEYYVLDNTEGGLVQSTIFPLPSEHSKGILVTPTIDGNILVGPTSYESDDSTITTTIGLNSIREKSSNLLNNVNLSKTIRIFAGVRAIVGDDFVIEKSKIANGVINLAGICSPGLSSAPAISKYVVGLLNLKYNPNVNKIKIKPYTHLKNMSVANINKLIAQNPAYGRIVCKCESISEGEIIDAINRPIPPTTIDGIKRRVRPGMGRCQGTFCADRVIGILAKENKKPFNSILKENKGSEYVVSEIKARRMQ